MTARAHKRCADRVQSLCALGQSMTVGSLFSGFGGLELGLEWAGLGPTLWQVEQDPYCRDVLAKNWPEVKRHDDVRTVGASTLEPVHIICGGFPCQDVSAAGQGAGLSGDRSGLWSEFSRIVSEMRPEWVVVENVTSGATRWLDAVVCELGELDYAALPLPLSASDVGAPHRRSRLFVVAHTERSRRETLFPSMADVNGLRKPQPQGGKQSERRRSSDPGWWSTEPNLDRVAHGVPARSHRLRGLGNAVVPQCAEVVGWVIRELAS